MMYINCEWLDIGNESAGILLTFSMSDMGSEVSLSSSPLCHYQSGIILVWCSVGGCPPYVSAIDPVYCALALYQV